MRIQLCLFGILAISVLGCGKELPLPEGVTKLTSAEGIALYQGQPLANATVTLLCRDGQHSASAMTNQKGQFAAKAFPQHAGVVPCVYKVVVSRTEDIEVDDGDGDAETHRTESRSTIPEKYSEASKTDLEVIVPEAGTTDLRIELVD